MFLGQPIRHAWNTVLSSKRMLLVVGLTDFVVCLPPTIYVLRQVAAASAHRTDALDLAKRFDPDLFADVGSAASGFDDNLRALVVSSLVLFFVLRPFVLGAYVGLAATRRRMHLGHAAREGGALYWKFLRLALVAIVAAYLLSIAAKPLLTQVNEWAASRTESTAGRYKLVTNVVVVGAFFAVTSIIFEYARVGMRMSRRPGVFRELGRSALFVLQHPASTLGMFLVSLVLEIGAIAGCGWLIQVADGGYFTTSAIVLVLVQLVVMLREAARLFHVAGAWQIRSVEGGDEHREAVISPETDAPDVLRAPLPWNLR
jgi:hypothetical protein